MSGLPQVKYTGAIREITFGKPGAEVTVGGEDSYSFYYFEGKKPNPPKLALQVLDVEPSEWAPAALEPFKDVIGDPVAWAKKCVDEYGADIVTLWLQGTDPNDKNLSAEHAAEVTKKVAEAINVPLIVWGVSNDEKNTEVFKAVCEACAGLNLVIGPVTEGNYKQVGAAAIAYKHVVAANSPIDINLAKQLNILLENLGVPQDKILVDPTTGGVGYGMEYCYSIMERLRQAALTQGDDKLQYPIINNIAEEVWKTKEAKLGSEEPTLGDPAIRGINLETITAISALQAGSDLLILRHPETVAHIKKYLNDLMVDTDLDSMNVDLSLVPEAKEAPAAAKPAPAAAKPAPAAKKAAPKAKPKPKPAAKKEEPKAAPAPAPKKAPEPAPAPAAAAPGGSADIDLSEEELQALREMIAMFKSVQGLFVGLGRLFTP